MSAPWGNTVCRVAVLAQAAANLIGAALRGIEGKRLTYGRIDWRGGIKAATAQENRQRLKMVHDAPRT
jgi:hypothetical protein